MTLHASRRLRWAVPGVVVAAVAGTVIGFDATAGASAPHLPSATAAHLLVSMERAHPQAFSGTVVQTADLGLPNLPAGDAGGSGLSPLSLLTGSHTMRIWYDGPSRQRVALESPMAERDVVHDGRQLWTYTSTTNTVTHQTLPVHAGAPARGHEPAPLSGAGLTPQQVAQQVLGALDPSTKVFVAGTVEVAGRPAYQLEVVPRDSRSLVGSVRLAVDSATSMPLRVQVYARGSGSPALSVGFTSIDLARPDASVFSFTKPPGATLAPLSSLMGSTGTSPSSGSLRLGKPTLLGSGWTAVVKVPTSGEDLARSVPMLGELAKPVPGGELLTTSLLSVLIGNDGAVYAGPVSGAWLQHVAATGSGR